MDAIMDLSARAVSFVTLIQDTFLKNAVFNGNGYPYNHIDDVFDDEFEVKFDSYLNAVIDHEKGSKLPDPDGIKSRVIDLVWLRAEDSSKQLDTAIAYVVKICTEFGGWVRNNQSGLGEKLADAGVFATPFVWREAINDLIYTSIPQRIDLAERLEYIPIHLVLALGGCGYEVSNQRLLQWWPKEEGSGAKVLKQDIQFHKRFQRKVADRKRIDGESDNDFDSSLLETYSKIVRGKLMNYSSLRDALLEVEAPLPFEYILTDELRQIERAREVRTKELLVANKNDLNTIKLDGLEEERAKASGNGSFHQDEKQFDSDDPLTKAGHLKLFALALSGGGIRSATFNLGILQGLAKRGVISKVDYLSTVSGGGYIGSWLTTWIKRNGSVKKVQDRLCTDQSGDPMAEEVRPIRWLRMYSNYFAPDKSIMSSDSWTVGVTWLRNTLLNQVVIFSSLLSVLFLILGIFSLWTSDRLWTDVLPARAVYIIICVLLVLIAFFTGLGMQWYNRGKRIRIPVGEKETDLITFLILGLAFIGSFMVSASLYAHEDMSFYDKLYALLPATAVCFFILIMIAVFGRYDLCIRANGITRFWAIMRLLYTAILSALIGCLALGGAWELIELMKGSPKANNPPSEFFTSLSFTLGTSLILLVFGITVVSRMAFLGRYFPDERREWWGRMGAIINRAAFIWMLIAAAIFLGKYLIGSLLDSWKLPVTLSGWLALMWAAVKAASSFKTSGKEDGGSASSKVLNLISIAGPYIFILGLMIFLPALAKPVMNNTHFLDNVTDRPWLKAILLSIIFFLPGLYLSITLGVNEFSMHHFYRNRLVRAYLGATRRKASREKTVNPFTGFDKFDDEKLADYNFDNKYYGPYPVLNVALNASQVSDLSRQDRKAESFIFSPLYCGYDFSKVESSANSLSTKSYDYGYRPTNQYAYPTDNGPGIGTAVAISGAAINPNQGYHSAAATAFLLTVFNVQMGWWMGNPRKSKWKDADPYYGLGYIFSNLIGRTSTRNEYVCLTDGGHFDNMGIYEMVRRRCRYIVLSDAEQDDHFTCEGLANAIRKCRVDFGAEIDISVDDIVNREGGYSKAHYALGTIKYKGEKTRGQLLYIKSSILGKEPVDIREYAAKNKSFPHQTTSDQFFDEEQFESYRKLGMHVAAQFLNDPKVIKRLDLKLDLEDNRLAKDDDENGKPPKDMVEALKIFVLPKIT